MLALLENIQRQNLSFLEEAEGYRNLMEDYGLTQEELADVYKRQAEPVADFIAVTTTAIMFAYQFKNAMKKLEAGKKPAEA